MKRTCWTITKDLLADPDSRLQTNSNAVTICGPRDAAKIFAHDWNNGSAGSAMLASMIATNLQAREFRMYDNDNELMYEGRILLGDENEAELIPLEDFGTPNAGATRIDIKNPKTGKWEII